MKYFFNYRINFLIIGLMIAGSVAQGELIQQNDEASRDEVVTKSERIVSEYLERLRQDPSFQHAVEREIVRLLGLSDEYPEIQIQPEIGDIQPEPEIKDNVISQDESDDETAAESERIVSEYLERLRQDPSFQHAVERGIVRLLGLSDEYPEIQIQPEIGDIQPEPEIKDNVISQDESDDETAAESERIVSEYLERLRQDPSFQHVVEREVLRLLGLWDEYPNEKYIKIQPIEDNDATIRIRDRNDDITHPVLRIRKHIDEHREYIEVQPIEDNDATIRIRDKK